LLEILLRFILRFHYFFDTPRLMPYAIADIAADAALYAADYAILQLICRYAAMPYFDFLCSPLFHVYAGHYSI